MNIVYLTAGSREFASSRLRAWKVGDALAALGHEVSFNPDLESVHRTADVVVVQKRFDLEGLMQQWRERGIRVIYDIDDWIPGAPVHCADVTTVDTPAKLELYPGSAVIPDSLDVEANSVRNLEHRDNLRSLVWYGNRENIYHLWNVVLACGELGLGLAIFSNATWDDLHPTMYKERNTEMWLYSWRGVHMDSLLIEYDLVVCPFTFGHNREGQWSDVAVRSKSANRLLKGWALGMPVAGTPIPSYAAAGLQYKAESVEDWIRVLNTLQSRELREADANRGYEIAQEFTADKVALKWLSVMEG